MSAGQVGSLLQQLLTLCAVVAAPILLAGMVVGVIVGIVQSATQIQENSLTFIPKLAATGLALVFSGSWILDKLINFFNLVVDQMSHGAMGGF